MLPTGYNIRNGVGYADLSTIFEPLPEGGTMYETPTGFIQYSTGKDLRELFAVNTSYTIPNDTNMIAQNGLDLRYIFQGVEPPLLVTITGGTAPTPTISGNKYTYTFTSGTRQISINKNISLNVIVVGGGGPGGNGTGSTSGGGGGGGGFGHLEFSYVSDTAYNISVASSVRSTQISGGSSSFTNSIGNGVISTGGARGALNNAQIRAASGTCTNNPGIVGTLVTRTGGTGGIFGTPDANGTNSSGSITVLGVTYNFGGGGRRGSGTSSNVNNRGGGAGADGIGSASLAPFASNVSGQSATEPGSGGGGGALFPSVGGDGGPGQVIVIFTYP